MGHVAGMRLIAPMLAMALVSVSACDENPASKTGSSPTTLSSVSVGNPTPRLPDLEAG